MDTPSYDDIPDEYAWLFGTAGLILWGAVAIIFLIAYIQIIRKAGYSGWWVLVGLVPLLNIVMFMVFAFSTWPVIRERDALRARTGDPGMYPPG
jgi:ATP/ADP translocase